MLIVLITSSSDCWWGRHSCPRIMGMAECRAPDTGQMKLIAVYYSHILTSQERWIPQAIKGLTGIRLNTGVNKQGLWKADFIVTKAWSALWFLWEDIFDQLEQTHRLVENWSPTLRDRQILCLVPVIRRVVWLGDLICRNTMGRWTWG